MRIPARRRHCFRLECSACWLQDKYDLTLAELDVISLLILGYTHACVIGAVLSRKSTTVNREICQVLKKTGHRDQLKLVLWALRNGLSDLHTGVGKSGNPSAS